jgi:hypothetical protein
MFYYELYSCREIQTVTPDLGSIVKRDKRARDMEIRRRPEPRRRHSQELSSTSVSEPILSIKSLIPLKNRHLSFIQGESFYFGIYLCWSHRLTQISGT